MKKVKGDVFLRRGVSPTVTAVALFIIGLIIGAVVVYFAVPHGVKTVTQTVTKTVTAAGAGTTATVTKTVTAGAGVTATVTQRVTQTVTKTVTAAGGAAGKIKYITIKIWTIGPDPPSIYRLKNFYIVADELNRFLEMIGANVRIKIDGQFFTSPVEWGTYKNKFYLAMKAGKGPHIYLTGHEDIGFLAENNYIIPLDKYIKEYWNTTFYDVIPTLWNAVKYKGHIWAVPQDTEVRPLYFRKDVLKKMGWSDEKIKEFPKLIEEGKITLWDILKIAKEAVDKGLVKRGLVHRVKEGYDYFQFYMGFGGRLWDPEKGKMVFCKDSWLETLKWFHAAVWEYHAIIPNQFSGDWTRDFHLPFTKGEALFCSGGSWHYGEWIKKGLLTEQQFKDNVGFALHPAGVKGLKPVTLSHPLIYTITTQAVKDGVADLCAFLIAMVTDPHLNSLHAVYSGHLAILNSEIGDSKYVSSWFLHDVAYMLKYTNFIPNHPKWGDYSRIVYNVLKAVESDKSMTAEKAFNILLTQIKRTLGDSVEIIDKCSPVPLP